MSKPADPAAKAHGLTEAHAVTLPPGTATERALIFATMLTFGFAGVEGAVGWWAHSLALLGDAGHMVTDASALLIAAFAAWVARWPPSPRHSYGLGRVQVVAALTNAVLMLALVSVIAVHAVTRLVSPVVVKGEAVTLVALVGLVINVLVAWILARSERDLNVRAALLHVLGDLLGSVTALVAGLLVWLTGWMAADPALSLLLAALIVFSSLRLAREALHGLMEGVPLHLSLNEVGQAMARVEGVVAVHDLHIWSLTAERIVLSAHVVVSRLNVWPAILARLQGLLQERFGIEHVTLQPELMAQVPWDR